MYPVLIRIGSFEITSFGALLGERRSWVSGCSGESWQEAGCHLMLSMRPLRGWPGVWQVRSCFGRLSSLGNNP